MSVSGETKVLAVIPARYASTRFPGKMLKPLSGRPLVMHAYQRAQSASLVDDVVVATDDQRIVDALTPLGVRVTMTRRDHPSGTDRVAEVAEHSDADFIVNVQGDEALIDPKAIDATIQPLLDHPEIPLATARRRITELSVINNPNVVKVVCDMYGRALYFSRSVIPHIRDREDLAAAGECYWQHIGIYAYRREFLLKYAKWPTADLEKLEKLEQLRVLERGYRIAVVDTDYENIGVDTPEDLERIKAILEA